MKLKKTIWFLFIVAVSMLLLSFYSCSSQQSFKDETITAENKAEIAARAATELTVEEARLLGLYLDRTYPDLAENDLPAGRTLVQMIEEQKAVEATSAAPAQPVETAEGDVAEAASSPPAAAEPVSKAPKKAETAPPPKRAETPPPAARVPETQPQSDAVASADSSFPDVPESTESEPAESLDNLQQADAADPIPEETVPELPQPITVEVASGTSLDVRLIEELSTETAEPGDWFETELAQDLMVENHLIATRGSRVRGRVMETQGAGKVKGVASMSFTMTDLFIDEERFPLQVETLSFEAEKTTGKDAAKVGVASGIGAILGAIIGGKKGAVIGAGVGAGAGTTTVLATKGDEIVFDVEQIFRFRLTQGLQVEILPEE